MERNKEQGKKQRNYKKETFEKRSPLQDLNGHQIRKAKTSNPSTVCSSSSSSSSLRTHFDRKLRTFSRLTYNGREKSTAGASKVVPKSKENEIPRRVFSHKSKKNQLHCLQGFQSGEEKANPSSKNGQKPKLSSDRGNSKKKLTKGFRDFEGKIKNSQGNDSGKRPTVLFKLSGDINLNCVPNCTPVGKIECASGSDLACFDVGKTNGEESLQENCNGNSDTAAKTPPVEASVSPEIQCGPHSKILITKSGATPVCYGAGHLLSGVTDKRKCRRRGSLRGGCEKANLFDDEESDIANVISDSRTPPIPLLAEASVRWHLSPCDEGGEDQGSDSEIRIDKCRTILGNGSKKHDLLSSPSSLCGSVSKLACDTGSFSGSGSVGDVASKRKAKAIQEFQGFFEPSNEKMDEHLLAGSPNSSFGCMNVGKAEGENISPLKIGDCSALSIGSLSSGNVIQTPNSDSSLEVDQRYSMSELGSIRQTLNKLALSPSSEMLMWSEHGDFADIPSPLDSINITQLQKNRDYASSRVYDSSLENFALSQMRISWRDGAACRILENDESDNCRCSSDEEIDSDGFSKENINSYPEKVKEKDLGIDSGQCFCLGNKSGANDENHLNLDIDFSPKFLDYEPIVSAKNKETLPPYISNTCAESICTTGGSLVASGDSDWGNCISNHLFQV